MRTLNEETKKLIIEFIDEYFKRYYKSPSMGIISNSIGLAKSAVFKYIHRMSEDGLLYYDKENKIITTEFIKKFKKDIMVIPLLGSVSCGKAFSSEENIKEYYFFPRELINTNNEIFFLKANGDSMINAGIEDGDIVMIKQTSSAIDNDIVVALIDNEVTLKRYFYDKSKNQICLHPENPNMSDLYVNSCVIQGVAIKVLKNI